MQKTIENLTKAFIGESQARNRYTFYAKTARDEGYEQIAAIFLETADQEKAHAKQLFRLINELKTKSSEDLSEIKVEASAPTIFGTTEENLKAAAEGEHYENTIMYPEFAATAQEEGLPAIAAKLRLIGKAEEHHEERYLKIVKEVGAGTVFKKDKEVWWVCRECGYVHFGAQPPEKCPVCEHPKAFFQLKCEEY